MYWLDLFTGTTWDEFRRAGAETTGFREHNWKRAQGIKKGDVFLCYLVGVKRWVGLLRVTAERYRDTRPIWGEEVFPVRFKVEPVVMLPPEHGVPMDFLKNRLSFFTDETAGGRWSGWVRASPTKYKKQDGDVIADALEEAAKAPVARPVDAKKLSRSSNLYKLHRKGQGAGEEEESAPVVSVPTDSEEEVDTQSEAAPASATNHTEIQWRLLNLGAQMGLNVWAPRNDRGRVYAGHPINGIPRLLDSLPTQFDEVTTTTIENIDVLWLRGNAIVAAFEVEHSTSIYSGLLRMSDLLTMQPNIDIKLYLAAPDSRFEKFKREVPRPTFASRGKPLHTVCGFLPYSELCARLEEVKNVLPYLRPEFIDEIAEFYDPEEEYEAA
jgi:hypothetical protein